MNHGQHSLSFVRRIETSEKSTYIAANREGEGARKRLFSTRTLLSMRIASKWKVLETSVHAHQNLNSPSHAPPVSVRQLARGVVAVVHLDGGIVDERQHERLDLVVKARFLRVRGPLAPTKDHRMHITIREN